jgi:hypothetical protein
MAEKRKRRSKRPALVQERANLDFPKSSSQQASSDNNYNEIKVPPLQQMTTNESDTTKSQARRLLDSQRATRFGCRSMQSEGMLRTVVQQRRQSSSSDGKPSTRWLWIRG